MNDSDSKLCPFCLAYSRFEQKQQKRRQGFTREYLACEKCNAQVPRMYVEDYREYPPAVVSAVGFTQHGKTVYFASLLYAMRCMNLTQRWPGFHTLCLNETSLETVERNLESLRNGRLPKATPKNFPTPMLLRVDSFPAQRNCTLLLYDTAGESFTRPSQLIQYARFVERARVVLFFISLPKCAETGPLKRELERLLETYIVGVRELGTEPKSQNLVVVYTMADRLARFMEPDWPYFRHKLTSPLEGDEANRSYKTDLTRLSYQLRRFTEVRIGAHGFLNMADGFFQRTFFCLLSSLGASPSDDNTLETEIVPRRILDPLLHVMRYGGEHRGWQVFRRMLRKTQPESSSQ